jgi:heavy metal sensor kinase
LWYGLAVGIALLGYAGIVFTFFRASLLEQLDARLHDDYEVAEHAFERAPDGSLRWIPAPSDPDARSEEEPWAEVSGPGGDVLLRRPAGAAPPSEGYRTRAYEHRLGAEEFRIRVGRSDAIVRRELREVLWIFGLSFIPAVVLAYLGGRVLARRALEPVEAMTWRASAITADRLAERLPVENPHDEMGRLATVFNEMIARLERSFGQLRRFTADASHELRTPLTAIRSVGEVGLAERRDEAGYREVIGSMLEEADRLTQLVEGLLTLARSDAGRMRPVRQRVDVRGLARDVAAHLSVLADEKGQALTVDEGAPVLADVDPVLLRQALTNLVDNAIKYGPPHSTVSVSVAERADQTTIEVTDEGPGVPPAHRGHVFERFYRVDPARRQGGVGLGLAIARAAAEAHGGTLGLSAEGKGSTFRLSLPRGSAHSRGSVDTGMASRA